MGGVRDLPHVAKPLRLAGCLGPLRLLLVLLPLLLLLLPVSGVVLLQTGSGLIELPIGPAAGAPCPVSGKSRAVEVMVVLWAECASRTYTPEPRDIDKTARGGPLRFRREERGRGEGGARADLVDGVHDVPPGLLEVLGVLAADVLDDKVAALEHLALLLAGVAGREGAAPDCLALLPDLPLDKLLEPLLDQRGLREGRKGAEGSAAGQEGGRRRRGAGQGRSSRCRGAERP